MYCRYCGSLIPDDSVFCSKCGKNINEADTQNYIETPEYTPESDEWYYKGDFDTFGPCTQAEIEALISQRRIDFDGEIKRSQDGEWIPLLKSQFAGLIGSLPPQTVAISDKWIWCLAIIPLLVSIFIGRLRLDSSLSMLTWLIPVALNFLFIKLDSQELYNASMNAESWMYMGILLVPVYLVVREVKTNHNYSPAILWCFVFAVDLFIL